MIPVFHFSLLRYQHALALGERLNVGLLFLFPGSAKGGEGAHASTSFHFVYPQRFTRIKAAYPQFPERSVRAYFRSVEKRLQKINAQEHNLFIDDQAFDVQAFINQELLVADGSALQFDTPQTAVLFSEDREHIIRQFYQLYLSLYDTEESSQARHDEAYLTHIFKQRLVARVGEEAFRKLQTDVPLEVGGVTYRFAYSWQNHAQHLVKPVSFDLLQEERIRRKAFEHRGQAGFLSEEAEEKNLQLDYLIAPPRQRTLHKAFEQAVHILEDLPRVNLIKERELTSYIEEAAQALA